MAYPVTLQRLSGRATGWVVAGGILVAIAAPLTLAQPPQHALWACPAGEDEDVFTNECVPIAAPRTSANTGNYSGNFSPSVAGGSANPDINEIEGIPCTGDNTGECIALDINQVPPVQPHSSVRSSP